MSNKDKMIFKVQFETISHEAVKGFQNSVLDQLVTDSNYFDKSPTELLVIENGTDLFEYIINDDYWVRHWSIYLIRQIVHLVYT
jgi:hypothetical protein